MRADLPQLNLVALPDIPMIRPGDDLAAIIAESLAVAEIALDPRDVLVITSKLVSKAEGRYVDLATVTPSERAVEVSAQTNKDPRLVELILRESTGISRQRAEVLIVRHRLGFTLANAGIDQSNVGADGE